ncbi:ProQ/FINO family protein [Methylobacterium radiotolerans]|uniref:ProQ/FINO family protein n=1 Tax=Methylobacterium radiotolerans TaxID=31998 RepID=UPI00097878A6|nr:ProQ/FINO family protein [Methylobacterium radiotolerans]
MANRYEVTRAAELCALLCERPPVFPIARGDPVRPLALGTLKALAPLARPEITPEQLKQALSAYCLGLGYLLAQGRSDAWRYDLAGRPVEPVSEEHRKGFDKV